MENQGEQLLTPEEQEVQAQWDEEFKRRQEDMARRELKSRERSQRVNTKMEELNQRWKMMEQRRVLRSRQSTSGEGLLTSGL